MYFSCTLVLALSLESLDSHLIWFGGRCLLWILQKHVLGVWQKDSKQCRGKDTALLHATKDVEGVRSGTIVQNCSFHVIMKGIHDAE